MEAEEAQKAVALFLAVAFIAKERQEPEVRQYEGHPIAFEIAAVILLLAIVAAITLTMRKRPGLKVQDIGKQVSVRAKDRIRIVKMDAEKKQ